MDIKTVEEQADKLIESFKDYVNPYVGSGMLSNNYDDKAIEWQSIRCALVVVDTILEANFIKKYVGYKVFWINVKQELTKRTKV